MKKLAALCMVLLLLLSLAGCGAGGGASSSSSGSQPAEETRYLKGISYVIPGDWRTNKMFDGYVHYAGDGSFLYTTADNFAPAKLNDEESAFAAIDSKSGWMANIMEGYALQSETAGSFHGHYSKEFMFTYKNWAEAAEEGSEAVPMKGHALLFVKSSVVYTLLFTGQQAEDTEADKHQIAVLESIV